jgi:hypothetical protein
MRKGLRVTLDPATEHAIQDLARRQSRPASNAALYLIKLGLEQVRAQQRPIGLERNAEPPQSS